MYLSVVVIALFVSYFAEGTKKTSGKTSKVVKHTYTPFQDPIYGDFGLRDEEKAVCLYLKFQAKMYNFNLNGTDIASEVGYREEERVTQADRRLYYIRTWIF